MLVYRASGADVIFRGDMTMSLADALKLILRCHWIVLLKLEEKHGNISGYDVRQTVTVSCWLGFLFALILFSKHVGFVYLAFIFK